MSIDTEDAFQPLLPERGAARPVELFATLALALCTLVAATAVSIGIARANVIALGAFSDPAPRAGCPPYCRLELAPPGRRPHGPQLVHAEMLAQVDTPALELG